MKLGKIVHKGDTKRGFKVLIRYSSKKDLQALCEFANNLSKERLPLWCQGEKISLRDEKEFLYPLLEKVKKKKAIHLLAISGKKLVGASSVKMGEGIDGHTGRFGVLIANGARRQGVGELLSQHVLKEAKKIPGLKIIFLRAFANNKPAISLYKKLGFIEYGRLPKGVKYRGRLVDRVFMYLRPK